MNVKDLQTKVITRMLRLQQPDPLSSTSGSASASTSSPPSFDPLTSGGWKVLIYDQLGSDILSPLLSVSELRRLGITLHINIKQKRDAVPDTPAVYFLSPTQPNIDALLADLSHSLYSAYHLHFTSSVPRPLLEHLAVRSAESGLSGRIARVYDEYVQFVCVDEQLFHLAHAHSFATINDTTQTDERMSAYVDTIVDSLFSLIVTLNTLPIIRAQPEGAAALVAQRLDERLRSHLIQRQNLFSGGMSSSGFQRPLLVLADRSLDLMAPLHHPWTYQALLNDLLGLSSNRLTLTDEAGPGQSKSKAKSYDLNSTDDKFWKVNAAKPFPSVAAAVQEKVDALKEEQAKVSKSTAAASTSLDDATADLSSAISALPKLQKRKRIVETHTNIATALLRAIKARDIDSFFEVEQQWMNRVAVERSEVERLVGSGKGTLRDRVRALLIWCLASGAKEEDVAAMRQLLTQQASEQKDGGSSSAAADLFALDYLKQYSFLHRLSTQPSAASAAAPSHRSDDSWSSSLLGKLANTVAKEVTAGVLAGVKNLMPANTDLPLTRAVDSLLAAKEGSETERWLYFDPKASKSRGGGGKGGARVGGFKEAIVFVVGGGCFVEYVNLHEYMKRNSGSGGNGLGSVVYGCTDLCSPEQFLGQLRQLGEGQQTKPTTAQLPPD